MTTLARNVISDACRPAINVAEDTARMFDQQRRCKATTDALDDLLTPSGTDQEYAERLVQNAKALRKGLEAELLLLARLESDADKVQGMLHKFREVGLAGEDAVCPCCTGLAEFVVHAAGDLPDAPRAWRGWSCECGLQVEVEL